LQSGRWRARKERGGGEGLTASMNPEELFGRRCKIGYVSALGEDGGRSGIGGGGGSLFERIQGFAKVYVEVGWGEEKGVRAAGREIAGGEFSC